MVASLETKIHGLDGSLTLVSASLETKILGLDKDLTAICHKIGSRNLFRDEN